MEEEIIDGLEWTRFFLKTLIIVYVNISSSIAINIRFQNSVQEIERETCHCLSQRLDAQYM
jgi:hypothetical protein